MEILDLLAHPQTSTPYVQIGFIIVLWSKVLFSNENLEFLPINQYISLIFKSHVFGFFLGVLSRLDGRLNTYLNILCLEMQVFECY
jgi:hypothetical protein